MKEIPILFSTPMVKAIIDGRKTMTRRIIKDKDANHVLKKGHINNAVALCKYRVGDLLWVRETWAHTKQLNLHPTDENYGFVYKADEQPWGDIEGWKWKPSIFMPKEAARIWLEVVSVKAERLQDITEEDAIKEGVEQKNGWFKNYGNYLPGYYNMYKKASESFFSLWGNINGLESLHLNNWVGVVEFKKIEKQ